MKTQNTQRLIVIAFLIALEVILTRFCSINTDILRIGFGFLPVAMVAMLYGPLWAGAAYAIGDLLGMMIFPTAGYFPGFTLTAFLTGCVYGVVLYGRPKTWLRILCAVLPVCLIINLCLDTLWLNITLGQGYLVLLPTRIFKCAVMIPIQTVLIHFIWDKCVSRIGFIKASQ